MTSTHDFVGDDRPWWFVRIGLLTTLAALVSILALLLSHPDVVDKGLHLAGLQ